LKVHLSFDIEVWCKSWAALDESFSASFDRYVYGRSPRGEYALPKTLEILQRHSLVGVFFVEPLFSARFGAQHLSCITDLIQAAGQDVQLHLHPEWTDEIRPPLIEHCETKRQHLTYYSLAEQAALIGVAKRLLEAAKGGPVSAFRAGGFAANRDTFAALKANGIRTDSSLNETFDHSRGSLAAATWLAPACIDGVDSYPVTVFTDGLGRPRAAQVGSCSFAEMRQALEAAEAAGQTHFVIVSHNFEMLKPGSSQADLIVAARFERLCAFLGAHRDRFEVGPYPTHRLGAAGAGTRRPRVSLAATAARHAQQLARRVI
jgi:peptidoglycan/xylan/chitin deacetylase (PgdA/CDA1 family)